LTQQSGKRSVDSCHTAARFVDLLLGVFDGHHRFAFVPLVARRISKAVSPRSKDSMPGRFAALGKGRVHYEADRMLMRAYGRLWKNCEPVQNPAAYT